MRHEKIFKREDGNKVKVELYLSLSHYGDVLVYNVRCSVCYPRKRTWIRIDICDNWDYRQLDNAGRQEYIQNKILGYVSETELLELKKELWLKLEPKTAF